MLIRKNMIAGAGPGRVPQLGFHLSSCPQCRERYQARSVHRDNSAAPVRWFPTLRLLPHHPSIKSKQRGLRLGIVTLLGFGLLLTWFIGLPLARAVGDVLVITSLDRSRYAQGSVGHLSSPPAALLASTTQAASVTPGPTSTTAIPTRVPVTATISTSPTPGSLAIKKPLVPTKPALRDLADRSILRDRTSPTPIAISTIEATPMLELPGDRDTSIQARAAVPTRKEQEAEPAADSTTVLFLGLDAREGEGFMARSDAILVAHLDPEQSSLSMLSLPRDLWVNIPGAGEGKINSAFVIGEQVGEGASLAKETVGEAIGVSIDYVVVMDFTGFRSLVDALDGITINVPTELYDPHFPTEDYGYRVAHFLPGSQRMDGEQALTYSRIRHPDSDFQRMRRQEMVVLAMARKLRERGMLRNLREADELTSALRPYMRTDMSPSVALNLLFAMRSVDLASAQYIAADGSMLIETNIGGAYAVYADKSVLHSLGAQLIEGK
jgi:LCP family protein required for cell wall assembly